MSTDMATGATRVPREALIGPASGIVFMALFGTGWALVATTGLQGAGPAGVLSTLAVALAVALFAAAAHFFRLARRLPQGDAARAARVRRWFFAVFAAELILIFVARAILLALRQPDLLVPASLVIVGVHFLPLARLFRYGLHYLTGALLVVVAAVTVAAFPDRATVAGHQVVAWAIVSAAGAAVVLWLTGGWLIVLSARVAREARD